MMRLLRSVVKTSNVEVLEPGTTGPTAPLLSNDEIERRGEEAATNEAALSQSSTCSRAHRRRDLAIRSNRLSDSNLTPRHPSPQHHKPGECAQQWQQQCCCDHAARYSGDAREHRPMTQTPGDVQSLQIRDRREQKRTQQYPQQNGARPKPPGLENTCEREGEEYCCEPHPRPDIDRTEAKDPRSWHQTNEHLLQPGTHEERTE
jgi:hypothetical protein